MRATVYEIERWVEIRLQRASQYNPERWYIWNDLTECEYLERTHSQTETMYHRLSFTTPEDALAYWNATKDVRR